MDEKRFNVVIVDAPNLLVEDFKPYWSSGQVDLEQLHMHPMNHARPVLPSLADIQQGHHKTVVTACTCCRCICCSCKQKSELWQHPSRYYPMAL